MLGRMSTQWRTIHQQHLQQVKIQITHFNSGVQWAAKLILLIWKHIYKVWIARNLARHGLDAEERSIKRRNQCIEELTLYYNYKDNRLLMPQELNSSMFYDSLQEHMFKESTLHQLDTWLSTYRDIILQSKQQKTQFGVQPRSQQNTPSTYINQ